MNNIFRIIDANFNRAREGLRVMEEYSRFIKDDSQLTGQLKEMRHRLCTAISAIPDNTLIDNRDTPGDVGTNITIKTEGSRKNIKSVLKAACSRLSEALRAIEEYGKTINPEMAAQIEQIRYSGYEFEKILIAAASRDRFEDVRLYTLITEEYCKIDPVMTAREILKGGVDCIQYREKSLDGSRTLEIMEQIKELCDQYNALLIINDRCDLNLACNGDGVHLGQSDLPPSAARRISGDSAILGLTCHNLDEVSKAKHEDIDYIGIGSIFGSITKPEVARTGTQFITDARNIYSKPIIAIGGVTIENASEAISAGASGVAVCQAIISQDNPGIAAEQMKKAIVDSK